jgi:hypothetical protein
MTTERKDLAAMIEEGRKTAQDSDGEYDDPDLYCLTRGGNRRGYHRLRLVRADGSAFSVLYADIHTMEMMADGTRLTLLLKNGLAVTLTGERLTVLADYLEEQHVRRLHIYDPAKHRFKEGIPQDRIPVIREIKEYVPSFPSGEK